MQYEHNFVVAVAEMEDVECILYERHSMSEFSSKHRQARYLQRVSHKVIFSISDSDIAIVPYQCKQQKRHRSGYG